MPEDIEIKVLGALEVRADGDIVTINGTRLQTLVAMLAMGAGREVHRSVLLDALWSDRAPALPDNALQALVSRVRRAAPQLVVLSRPTGYRLAVSRDQVDAHRFESRVRTARHLPDPGARAAELRSALALWRGPALAGLAQIPALRADAARLTELRRTALEERIAADLELGAGVALVPELEGLIAESPLRETLRVHLMRALRAAGRNADALSAYEAARTALAESLGTDPSPRLRELHLELLRESRDTPSAPRPAPRPKGGGTGWLPNSLTPLLGRDADLERVAGLLAAGRLVTVVGPGGVGKTRFAFEVARQENRDREQGWLAELAGVTDPADVPRAILDATGAGDGDLLVAAGPSGARPDVLERLVSVLAGQRVLLVLDNCEHVIAEVAAVADRLLARTPALRILATSRQPLGLTGEQLYPLDGLALPARPDLAAAAASPAIRLFTDRGRAVRPSFTLDHDNVASVTTICRALDGLPLALEIAAARLRSLSPAQIVARLNDRFTLFLAGNRVADERQRTLRAVVDWSWELLDESERTLARRFAVFAGPVPLSLVERVCAEHTPVGPAEVDRLLAALVDKSVVQADDDQTDVRFRMLDTIRLYALEQLTAAGEEPELRLRHAQAMVAVSEAHEPRLRRGDQLAALAALNAVVNDLNQALRWSSDAAPPEVPVRLIAALEWFWVLSGRRAEGIEWTDVAMSLDASRVPAARALLCAVTALQRGALLGEPTAVRYLAEALELTATLDPATPGASHPILVMLGLLAPLMRGDVGALEDVLRRCADNPDPWVRAQAAMSGGRLLMSAGRPRQAQAGLAAALAGFRELGERLGLAQALSAVAEIDSGLGEHARAVRALTEAVAAADELGAAEDRVGLLVRRGAERVRAGDPDGARTDLDAAMDAAAGLGLGEAIGAAHHVLGDLHRWAGHAETARNLLERALGEVQAHGRGVGYRPMILTSQGHLAVAQGRIDAAVDLCRQTFQLSQQAGDVQVTSRVAVLAADIALAGGDVDLAAALVAAAETAQGQAIGANPDEVRISAATRERIDARRASAALGTTGTTGTTGTIEMEALLRPVISEAS